MRIGPITTEHYEEMISLWEAAGLAHRPRGRDRKNRVIAEIRENPELFLGAFEDDRLVGTVIGTWDRRKGMVNRLAVHPDYRGRGYAKKLIEACEDTLRRLGAEIICALVDDHNKESLALFQRTGYVLHPDVLYLSKRDSPDT